MSEALILAIIEAGFKYGPGIAAQIAAEFENGDPTPESIRALKIDKEPETYFETKPPEPV
jgi:hypothetical protein